MTLKTLAAKATRALTASLLALSLVSCSQRNEDGTNKLYVSAGNPDARILDQAMESRRPVHVAIRLGYWSLVSNEHPMRSVFFADDTTQAFGEPTEIDWIIDRWGLTHRVVVPMEYRIIECLVESRAKELVDGGVVYRIRIRKDLTN